MENNMKERTGNFFKIKKQERKVIHEECVRSIDKQLVTENGAFLWLLRGDMKSESESVTIKHKIRDL